MAYVAGTIVQIFKPYEDPREPRKDGPCWSDQMDYLDGASRVIEREVTPGVYKVKKEPHQLREEWMAPMGMKTQEQTDPQPRILRAGERVLVSKPIKDVLESGAPPGWERSMDPWDGQFVHIQFPETAGEYASITEAPNLAWGDDYFLKTSVRVRIHRPEDEENTTSPKWTPDMDNAKLDGRVGHITRIDGANSISLDIAPQFQFQRKWLEVTEYAEFPETEENEDETDTDDEGSDEDSDQDFNPNPNKETRKVATKKLAMKNKDVKIVREGTKIIIPETMSMDELIEWGRRKKHEDEMEVQVHEVVDCFPFDGAAALARALSKKYGWVGLIPTPGFFGPQPPAMIGVEISLGVTVQIPWGRIQIPNIQGYIETQFWEKDGRPCFALGGVVRNRDKGHVTEIARLVKEEVRTNSIYKGKAISVEFPKKFDPNKCPKFLDLRKVKEDELIFAEDVKRLLHTALFTPVEKTDECRRYQVPLKRGILLEGPYGTGKTLTAYVAAKKCVENDWTFVYLSSPLDLTKAVHFAKQYQPCMIFAEDVDRALEGEERDVHMDAILNTIDGIESKNTEIAVVLTTNHVEKINQAMLRPGRLDAVIHVKKPDAEAVQRLIQLFGRGLVREGEDLKAVGLKLRDQIPAVIREVVERSKLAAIGRGEHEGELTVTADDLIVAADGMLNHLRLLEPKPEDKRTPMETLGDRLGERIGTALYAAHSGQAGGLPARSEEEVRLSLEEAAA